MTTPRRERYHIEVTPAARRDILKLPAGVQQKIVSAIDSLAGEPRPAGVVKLSGPEDLYRIREGAYRIIYQIQDRVLLVVVVRVGHRREAYRKR
jgi:mRNA interferase RelE/StbE